MTPSEEERGPLGPDGKPRLQIVSSRGFVEWLGGERLSLAFTTYQAGGLILLGRKPNNELAVFVSAFDRAMGLYADGQRLWLATTRQLLRLENSLAPGMSLDGYDRVFVPRVAYTTGDVDVHDVAIDGNGQPVFANTLFSCLATVHERFNFRPLWKPPFISSLCPEDRCHLNGLALVDGKPRYMSAVAKSDVAAGWRDFRVDGGVVVDIASNELVARGLSMPHSPRWHDGKLWLLNSGTGEVGWIELDTGKFVPVAFVPGYSRGLAFHGKYAIIGLSRPRREHAFQGLPLQQRLQEKNALPQCGLQILETATGAAIHWARIESVFDEIYDVAVIPGVTRPKALSFASTRLGHVFSFEDEGRLQHWSSEPSPAAPRNPGQRPTPPSVQRRGGTGRQFGYLVDVVM